MSRISPKDIAWLVVLHIVVLLAGVVMWNSTTTFGGDSLAVRGYD